MYRRERLGMRLPLSFVYNSLLQTMHVRVNLCIVYTIYNAEKVYNIMVVSSVYILSSLQLLPPYNIVLTHVYNLYGLQIR